MAVFLWFSFPPHYEMLANSAEQVRTLDPCAALAVAIHRGDPPPAGHWDLVIETDFPRGHHLDGRAAAVGVAETISHAARQLGTQVVKLDSDMVLLSTEWLRAPSPICALRLGSQYVGCYSIMPRLAGAVAGSFIHAPPCSRHEANAICDRAAAITIAGGRPPAILFREHFPTDLIELQSPYKAPASPKF